VYLPEGYLPEVCLPEVCLPEECPPEECLPEEYPLEVCLPGECPLEEWPEGWHQQWRCSPNLEPVGERSPPQPGRWGPPAAAGPG